MSIVVCPLSRVFEMVEAHAPERIVSLLDPHHETPDVGEEYAGRHLRLTFHDAHISKKGVIVPSSSHVAELVSFVQEWSRARPLLVHCRAGIGRSTAGAFVAACVHSPDVREMEIARELRRAGPLARPNETLVRLADEALGRDGRMTAAIQSTGQGLPWIAVAEGEPFVMALK